MKFNTNYTILLVLLLSLYVTAKRGDYGEANPPGKSLSWDRMHNIAIPELPPNPITTNYREMLHDQSKIAITMGVPEHIDFERNLAIPGDPYEDPVFVNDQGQEVSANEAVAESEIGADNEVLSNEQCDEQNEQIIQEIEQAKITSPDEAHDLIINKHAQIMVFLGDIAKLKWLNTNEKHIVQEIANHIQLLKNRHELIRNTHDEQLIEQIDVSVHKITIALDEHTFNAHGMRNRAESIYHHLKENKRLDRKLDQAIEGAYMVMDHGPNASDESIIAVGKVDDQAERNTKIQNIRLVQDLCELEIPLRNRPKMTEYVESYKEQQNVETKRINSMIDNLEALIKGCSNILLLASQGQESEVLIEHIKGLHDSADTPQNVQQSLNAAISALDLEDMNGFDTKINLSLERSKFWMDKTIATAGSLIFQTQQIRKTEASIKDGDRFLTTGYEYLEKIVDEVAQRQPIVRFTPILEEKIGAIYNEVRYGTLNRAIELTKEIVKYAHVNGYTELIGGKLPFDKSVLEERDEYDDAESNKVHSELKEIRGDIAAGNVYEANVKVDFIRGILQKRAKVTHIRTALSTVQSNADSMAIQDIALDLKKIIDAEMDNAMSFKDDQSKLLEHLEHTKQVAIGVQPWEDSVKAVEDMASDPSTTANVHLSIIYGLKYAKQDDRNDTMKFLDRAYDQVADELSLIERTMVSLQYQVETMNALTQSGSEGDVASSVANLERLLEEVEKAQVYVKVDNNIETRIREIKDLAIKGDATSATLRLEKLAEQYLYLPEESTAEKKVKQDQADPRHPITLTEEPVVPRKDPNFEEQNALEIARDTQSAIESIEGTKDNSVPKEGAQQEVEIVESKIQKSEKLDDINTTQEKFRRAHEAGDAQAVVEAINDLQTSISDEEVFLKTQKEHISDCRERVTSLIDASQDTSIANQQISKDAEVVLMHPAADAGTRSYIRTAQDSLALGKIDQARDRLFDAKEHLERSFTDVDNSVHAVERQLDFLSSAKDFANEGDYNSAADRLTKVRQSTNTDQKVFFTDKEANMNKNVVIQDIKEGRHEQAAALLQEFSEKAQQNIREPITMQFPEGVKYQRAEAEKTKVATAAYEAIGSDSTAAGRLGVEGITDAAQREVKTFAVQNVEQQLLDDMPVDETLIEILGQQIQSEKEQFENENISLEQDLDKLYEMIKDVTSSSLQKDLQSILDEAIVDAQTQISLQEAINSVEEKDMTKADLEMQTAIDQIEENIRANTLDIKSLETQEEKLEDAKTALTNGNNQEAIDLVREVQIATDDQNRVKASEEIEQVKSVATELVSNGEHEAAQATVGALASTSLAPVEYDWVKEGQDLQQEIKISNWPTVEQMLAKFLEHQNDAVRDQAGLLEDVVAAKDLAHAIREAARLVDLLHEDTVKHLPPYEEIRNTWSFAKKQDQAKSEEVRAAKAPKETKKEENKESSEVSAKDAKTEETKPAEEVKPVESKPVQQRAALINFNEQTKKKMVLRMVETSSRSSFRKQHKQTGLYV